MFRESSELQDRMFWKQWASTLLFGSGILCYLASCLTWLWNMLLLWSASYMCHLATLLMLVGLILHPSLLRRVLTWSSLGLCLFSLLIVVTFEDFDPDNLATFTLHAVSFLLLAIQSESRISLSRMYDLQEGMFRLRMIEKSEV